MSVLIQLRIAMMVTALATLSTTSAGASRWQSVERVPGHIPVGVDVDGKTRTYFRIDPTHPLTVAVDGPAKLRVMARAEMTSASGVLSYVVSVSENGHLLEKSETESSVSDRVRIPGSNAVLGKRRR